jgi:hypothetical protein
MRVYFVEAELQSEGILSLKTIKVSIVELTQHQHHRRVFLQDNSKLLLERGLPRYVDTDPFLGYSPIRIIHKQARAFEVLVFAQQILV